MRASHVAVAVLLAAVTLVGVTFLVAWLLEDTIAFSLMCGIPAGVAVAIVVAVATVFLLRSRDGAA